MQLSRDRVLSDAATASSGRIWMRTDADRDGNLVSIEARVVFDGGAYASTSELSSRHTAMFIQGPTGSRTGG